MAVSRGSRPAFADPPISRADPTSPETKHPMVAVVTALVCVMKRLPKWSRDVDAGSLAQRPINKASLRLPGPAHPSEDLVSGTLGHSKAGRRALIARAGRRVLNS